MQNLKFLFLLLFFNSIIVNCNNTKQYQAKAMEKLPSYGNEPEKTLKDTVRSFWSNSILKWNKKTKSEKIKITKRYNTLLKKINKKNIQSNDVILRKLAAYGDFDILYYFLSDISKNFKDLKTIYKIINAKGPKSGNTALYYTIKNKNYNCTLLLLGFDTKIAVKNNRGVSPLKILLEKNYDCSKLKNLLLFQINNPENKKESKGKNITCPSRYIFGLKEIIESKNLNTLIIGPGIWDVDNYGYLEKKGDLYMINHSSPQLIELRILLGPEAKIDILDYYDLSKIAKKNLKVIKNYQNIWTYQYKRNIIEEDVYKNLLKKNKDDLLKQELKFIQNDAFKYNYEQNNYDIIIATNIFYREYNEASKSPSKVLVKLLKSLKNDGKILIDSESFMYLCNMSNDFSKRVLDINNCKAYFLKAPKEHMTFYLSKNKAINKSISDLIIIHRLK